MFYFRNKLFTLFKFTAQLILHNIIYKGWQQLKGQALKIKKEGQQMRNYKNKHLYVCVSRRHTVASGWIML